MKLSVYIPEVYAMTEDSLKLLVKMKDNKVSEVIYNSMNDRCFEALDFISVPEGATNGDMLKAVFPNENISQCEENLENNMREMGIADKAESEDKE